jgi:urease accessory protein
MNDLLRSSPKDASTELGRLRLLHLADSALPIGAMAHSFGIEGLVAEAGLRVEDLPSFFLQWLHSSGRLEAAFCHRAAEATCQDEWVRLNQQMSAFKIAAESREASLRLGKRFQALAATLITGTHDRRQVVDARLAFSGDVHLATAFGLTGSILEIENEAVAGAYLHQALYGAISACQRLLPFGQSAAMKLLWELKPTILEIARESSYSKFDDLWNLQPMLEITSMRHPHLETRLFIS